MRSHIAYGTKLVFPKALIDAYVFFWIENGNALKKADHLSHAKPVQCSWQQPRERTWCVSSLAPQLLRAVGFCQALEIGF